MRRRLIPTLREVILEGLSQEEFIVKQMVNIGLGQGLLRVLKQRGVENAEEELFAILTPDVHAKIAELAQLAASQLDAIAARSAGQ